MNRSRIFPSLMIAGTSGYVKFAAAGGGMAALLHVGRSSSSSPAQAKLRAPLGRADPARSADYCPPRLRCDGMRPLWGISFAGQNHSRRWRQVGGPRRVSPTVLKSDGPRRSPLLLSIHGTTAKELRPASGRAGATIGASKASRTPECGTLCCRRRGMAALLHVGRSSFSSSFLTGEELRARTIHADGDK